VELEHLDTDPRSAASSGVTRHICAVVLVTAQDLQAITLAPVETPGCEGAIEPVCTLACVSHGAKVTCACGDPWVGDYVSGCTKGSQGRSFSPSLMVTG
jgi:hypothetical protein